MLLPLSLAAVALAAVPAVSPAVPAEPGPWTAGETNETIDIETSDRFQLKATYFEPGSKSERAPAAMILHDAGKDRSQVEELAKYLQRKGFGVLTLDLRGHGASASEDLSWSGLDQTSRERLWAFAMRDLKAGADFLRDRREIHSSNLSLVGIGASASLAVRYALDDENARAVVLISPRAENFGFNLLGGVSDLEGLPTLLVTSSDDRDVAARLQNAGHRASGGYEYIELTVSRASEEEILDDTRTRASLASWLRDEVMPKR